MTLPPSPTDGLSHLFWLAEKETTETNLPPRGAVFWPVGTRDSTTLVVDDEHVLQIDLRATAPPRVMTPRSRCGSL